MIHPLMSILTVLLLLGGMFFMLIGAVGIWRLPDTLCRMHASSKCIALGITGLLLAAIVHLAHNPDEGGMSAGYITATLTKALLVIAFQFVASPIAAHMLARAAHADGAPMWDRTSGDELDQDTPNPRRQIAADAADDSATERP